MREIKFRAWDKTENKMDRNVKELRFNSKTGLFGVLLYHMGFEYTRRAKDVELMQYTGLKDKNGKEIYEGDIISAWSQGWNAIGEVKHRIDGLWFMYPAYQHKIMWGLCPNPEGKTSVEVIGNIYENPELLKEE